ncbi:MAG: TonB-dependent receptor [Cyclobacteriaceae bacterium]
MIRSIILLLLFTLSARVAVASTVSGKVTDKSGEGIPGVNVYIKDTYDGATTSVTGEYNFSTAETGVQVLVTSFIGYKTQELIVDLTTDLQLDILMKEEISKLNGVVITAGSFEASDENKAVVFKPLDIATTAGATADIAGALNTLPGTTTNGETGSLFVRGGTADETKAFINGMMVGNFYSASPNNIPTRARFSPFLFKGTFFSAGGYSAEYGQALSSVLSLNSIDTPTESKTDLSFMSVGGAVSHTQHMKNSGINAQFAYTNLDPYIGLVKQDFDWENGYTSENGTLMYWHDVNKSDRFKFYANWDRSAFVILMPNINNDNQPDRIDLTNRNLYLNSSYMKSIGKESMLFTGVSYGVTNEDINFNKDVIDEKENGWHVKSYLNTQLASNVGLKVGAEVIGNGKDQDFDDADNSSFHSEFDNILTAGFVESDIYASKNMTFRAGLRLSNYSLIGKAKLSPRVSMAYKTGEFAQVSLAYGKFHQLAESDMLLRSSDVDFEESAHYIANYQMIREGKTFRAEVYYKGYDNLVKFDSNDEFNPTSYNNLGDGYAKGIDILWKDDKTIKNGQYWVSYSFIDTKRDFKDFPYRAVPGFAARHNLSLVYKYFITEWKTQVGTTFSYNSGRPYHNPNKETFNSERTKHYANLSFNFAYLPRQNIVIYASATNLLGRDNVFGYEFENDPGMDGVYDSRAIGQAAKRFLFLGVFITLTKDKTQNQLDNL